MFINNFFEISFFCSNTTFKTSFGNSFSIALTETSFSELSLKPVSFTNILEIVYRQKRQIGGLDLNIKNYSNFFNSETTTDGVLLRKFSSLSTYSSSTHKFWYKFAKFDFSISYFNNLHSKIYPKFNVLF